MNKKISKPPMVDEHAFPPTGFSCCRLCCSLSFMVLSTSLALCFYPPCSCPTGPRDKDESVYVSDWTNYVLDDPVPYNGRRRRRISNTIIKISNIDTSDVHAP